MKAEELMIGDYIKHGFGGIGKVTELSKGIVTVYDKGLDDGEGNCEVNFAENEIHPIPLTTEILEKNGFVLKPDGWLWCEEEGSEEQNYIFIQFRKGCDEVRIVELNFVNNVLAKFRKIQSVHELQHVLRLCGIKKEIVL